MTWGSHIGCLQRAECYMSHSVLECWMLGKVGPRCNAQARDTYHWHGHLDLSRATHVVMNAPKSSNTSET